jgi:hypothetical protein
MHKPNKGYLMLQSSWAVLFGIAIFVTFAGTGGSAPPEKVYGDACGNTCRCTFKVRVDVFTQNCCLWDWGCWFNPLQPNYQFWRAKRYLYQCIEEPPESNGALASDAYCCGTWFSAEEETGPYCNPVQMNCPQQ